MTTDWEKACDHAMPNVCRPANPNQPRNTPKSRSTPAPYEPPALLEEKPSPTQVKIRIALRIGVFFEAPATMPRPLQ